MSYASWGALLALAFFWSGSFVFVGYALDYLDPLTVVAFRVSLAAPVLWAVVLWRRIALPGSLWIWFDFLVLGIVNNTIPHYMISWGQQYIDSGMAALLNGATPLFGALLAHMTTDDEKLSPVKIAGLLLGLAGLAILMQPTVVVNRETLMGQGAVLFAAFSYAVASILGKRLKNVPPVVTAAGQLTSSALILMPLSYAGGGLSDLPAHGTLWLVILALALLSTALTVLLLFTLIKRVGAVNTMTVTLLIPLFATVMGMVWLGERPTLISWVSMILVLAGVGLVVRGGRPAPARRKAGSAA